MQRRQASSKSKSNSPKRMSGRSHQANPFSFTSTSPAPAAAANSAGDPPLTAPGPIPLVFSLLTFVGAISPGIGIGATMLPPSTAVGATGGSSTCSTVAGS